MAQSEQSPSVNEVFLQESIEAFQSMKQLADKAMKQVDDSQFHCLLDKESNSLEVMILHMHGNMLSRWTDFLTSDGEKPTRDRDGEFEPKGLDRPALIALWEQGWSVLFDALSGLKPDDLLRQVAIRGEGHTVIKAIQRQVSHYGYHVGQIVFLAKHLSSEHWQTLSTARGQSKAFKP